MYAIYCYFTFSQQKYEVYSAIPILKAKQRPQEVTEVIGSHTASHQAQGSSFPERAVGQSRILPLSCRSRRNTGHQGSEGLLITSRETEINNSQAGRLVALWKFINGLRVYQSPSFHLERPFLPSLIPPGILPCRGWF